MAINSQGIIYLVGQAAFDNKSGGKNELIFETAFINFHNKYDFEL